MCESQAIICTTDSCIYCTVPDSFEELISSTCLVTRFLLLEKSGDCSSGTCDKKGLVSLSFHCWWPHRTTVTLPGTCMPKCVSYISYCQGSQACCTSLCAFGVLLGRPVPCFLDRAVELLSGLELQCALCHPSNRSWFVDYWSFTSQAGVMALQTGWAVAAGQLAPLMEASCSIENFDSRLLQSCPEGPGRSRDSQETVPCVYHRVTA